MAGDVAEGHGCVLCPIASTKVMLYSSTIFTGVTLGTVVCTCCGCRNHTPGCIYSLRRSPTARPPLADPPLPSCLGRVPRAGPDSGWQTKACIDGGVNRIRRVSWVRADSASGAPLDLPVTATCSIVVGSGHGLYESHSVFSAESKLTITDAPKLPDPIKQLSLTLY